MCAAAGVALPPDRACLVAVPLAKENNAAVLFVHWNEGQAWPRSDLNGPARWHGNLSLAKPLLENPDSSKQKPVVFVQLVNQAECLVDAVVCQIGKLLPSLLKLSAQSLRARTQ